MKNKGFTLIELLAVILILGIIALIAIPTVSSVVEQAREGAKKTTISNYMKAVDEYIMMQELTGEKIPDGIYTFNDFIDKVDIKGDISGLEGTIIVSSNSVENYFISDGEKTYTEKEDKISYLDNSKRENSTLRYPFHEEEKNTSSILDFDKKDSILNIYLVYDYIPNNYAEKIELSNDHKINGYLVPVQNEMYNYIISSENNIVTTNSIRYIFSGYKNAKRIVLDNIDTSNTSSMGFLFAYDEELEEIIGAEKLVTKKASSIEQMFHTCKKIKRLDLSKWDTSNVGNLGAMFANNYELEYLNISTWNTSKVTNMGLMFSSCKKLKEINVTNFDTHLVTTMAMMFYHNDELKEIDLSSFDTSSITSIYSMFASDSNLERIYVSDKWDISGVENTKDMFSDDKKLVGKIPYDSTKPKDKTMATIDGYLTLKN